YASKLPRIAERLVAQHGLDERTERVLRRMATKFEAISNAPERKIAMRLRQLANGQSRSVVKPGEAWSDAVIAHLAKQLRASDSLKPPSAQANTLFLSIRKAFPGRVFDWEDVQSRRVVNAVLRAAPTVQTHFIGCTLDAIARVRSKLGKPAKNA